MGECESEKQMESILFGFPHSCFPFLDLLAFCCFWPSVSSGLLLFLAFPSSDILPFALLSYHYRVLPYNDRLDILIIYKRCLYLATEWYFLDFVFFFGPLLSLLAVFALPGLPSFWPFFGFGLSSLWRSAISGLPFAFGISVLMAVLSLAWP